MPYIGAVRKIPNGTSFQGGRILPLILSYHLVSCCRIQLRSYRVKI
jgi:hypothetical protein